MPPYLPYIVDLFPTSQSSAKQTHRHTSVQDVDVSGSLLRMTGHFHIVSTTFEIIRGGFRLAQQLWDNVRQHPRLSRRLTSCFLLRECLLHNKVLKLMGSPYCTGVPHDIRNPYVSGRTTFLSSCRLGKRKSTLVCVVETAVANGISSIPLHGWAPLNSFLSGNNLEM